MINLHDMLGDQLWLDPYLGYFADADFDDEGDAPGEFSTPGGDLVPDIRASMVTSPTFSPEVKIHAPDSRLFAEQKYSEAVVLSKLARTQERHESIQLLLDAAIELDPYYVNAYFDRGKNYQMNNQFEKAYQDFVKVTELDPTHAEAYGLRGWLRLYHRRRPDDALRDFTQAIVLDDELPEVYNDRALIYYTHFDRFDDALKDIDAAITFEPDNETFLNNRIALSDVKRRRTSLQRQPIAKREFMKVIQEEYALIRSAPDTKASLVLSLTFQPGEEVEILEKCGNWTRISDYPKSWVLMMSSGIAIFEPLGSSSAMNFQKNFDDASLKRCDGFCAKFSTEFCLAEAEYKSYVQDILPELEEEDFLPEDLGKYVGVYDRLRKYSFETIDSIFPCFVEAKFITGIIIFGILLMSIFVLIFAPFAFTDPAKVYRTELLRNSQIFDSGLDFVTSNILTTYDDVWFSPMMSFSVDLLKRSIDGFEALLFWWWWLCALLLGFITLILSFIDFLFIGVVRFFLWIVLMFVQAIIFCFLELLITFMFLLAPVIVVGCLVLTIPGILYWMAIWRNEGVSAKTVKFLCLNCSLLFSFLFWFIVNIYHEDKLRLSSNSVFDAVHHVREAFTPLHFDAWNYTWDIGTVIYIEAEAKANLVLLDTWLQACGDIISWGIFVFIWTVSGWQAFGIFVLWPFAILVWCFGILLGVVYGAIVIAIILLLYIPNVIFVVIWNLIPGVFQFMYSIMINTILTCFITTVLYVILLFTGLFLLFISASIFFSISYVLISTLFISKQAKENLTFLNTTVLVHSLISLFDFFAEVNYIVFTEWSSDALQVTSILLLLMPALAYIVAIYRTPLTINLHTRHIWEYHIEECRRTYSRNTRLLSWLMKTSLAEMILGIPLSDEKYCNKEMILLNRSKEEQIQLLLFPTWVSYAPSRKESILMCIDIIFTFLHGSETWSPPPESIPIYADHGIRAGGILKIGDVIEVFYTQGHWAKISLDPVRFVNIYDNGKETYFSPLNEITDTSFPFLSILKYKIWAFYNNFQFVSSIFMNKCITLFLTYVTLFIISVGDPIKFALFSFVSLFHTILFPFLFSLFWVAIWIYNVTFKFTVENKATAQLMQYIGIPSAEQYWAARLQLMEADIMWNLILSQELHDLMKFRMRLFNYAIYASIVFGMFPQLAVIIANEVILDQGFTWIFLFVLTLTLLHTNDVVYSILTRGDRGILCGDIFGTFFLSFQLHKDAKKIIRNGDCGMLKLEEAILKKCNEHEETLTDLELPVEFESYQKLEANIRKTYEGRPSAMQMRTLSMRKDVSMQSAASNLSMTMVYSESTL